MAMEKKLVDVQSKDQRKMKITAQCLPNCMP